MAGAHENYSGRNKLADAVMVRGVGQESFIYRTEKPEDPEKGKLMLNIRKAVEELRKGLQSEMEANNKAKETINYFASRDPGLLQKTELLETLSDIKDMLIEVDGKQQNLRWVEGEMDELDIDIALQRFDLAVDRVDKLKSLARGLKNNVIAQDFINFKVQERCSKLSGLITRELVETHGERSKTKRNVDWLSRLGFEDRARESYLEARSTLIQKRSRYVTSPQTSYRIEGSQLTTICQTMYFPRRLARLYLAIVICILQHYSQHCCVLPGVLPTSHDECMC